MDASTRDLLVVGGGTVGRRAAIAARERNPQLTSPSWASPIRAVATRFLHKVAQAAESAGPNFEDRDRAPVQVIHGVRILPGVNNERKTSSRERLQ